MILNGFDKLKLITAATAAGFTVCAAHHAFPVALRFRLQLFVGQGIGLHVVIIQVLLLIRFNGTAGAEAKGGQPDAADEKVFYIHNS